MKLTTLPYFEPVIGALLAYSFYMAAALLANAEFPKFLRDHLFDGLAPAAVVGFLISRVANLNQLAAAFPRIQRPVNVCLLFALIGSIVFGLIAAAAVFSSGSSQFYQPVLYCAIIGGFINSSVYFVVISKVASGGGTFWSQCKWMFRKWKRGEDLATHTDFGRKRPTPSNRVDSHRGGQAKLAAFWPPNDAQRCRLLRNSE